MPAPTILVCGHLTIDRLGDAAVPGGSAYYAAVALAALGARPRVLAAAGPDFPARALGGIEAEIVPSAQTTTFENTYRAGRRSQRVLAAAPPLDPRRLPLEWRGADALLVAPVLGECDPPAFVAAAQPRMVGLCIQGLVREVGPGGTVVHRPIDVSTARGADAAFLGEDDADDPGDLGRLLAATVPIVVITRGALGCDVLCAGRASHVGVYPAREVDPTGAGDVFAAAFLFGLATGADPVEAARLGAAAASIAVEGRGGEALGRVGEAFSRAGKVPVERA